MSEVANGQVKHLGVTPPIALSFPTTREGEVTGSLLEELKEQGTFESEEESRRREEVLGKIDKLVKDFVYQTSLRKNLPEDLARESGGKIFTFGSYRLGVHGAGTDIDTLCVVPRHVQREDFFKHMHALLASRNEVTELTAVTDAYVPVIKMKFQDIPIDLVFASLAVPKVPDNLDLRDNLLLKNLEEPCIRSLNGMIRCLNPFKVRRFVATSDYIFDVPGSRVTDEILRLVPNIPTFRTSLRCIKLWAKRRAISSNVIGFFGGVAWAMLVARICQLYPNAIAGAIVSRFFRIIYQWKWPQPVLLKAIEEDRLLPLRVWNPKMYQTDRSHLMPIITPAYPSMCATHNVTASTKKIIEEEFKRAVEIADRVMIGTGKWADLFQKHDFFQRYRYYLQIIASSHSPEHQLKWAGMVESRIRHLITKLEVVENLGLAHPFVKGFEKVHYCKYEEEESNVILGNWTGTPASDEKDEQIPDDKSNDAQTGSFRVIYTTTFYVGLAIEPRAAGSTQPRQLDISWPRQEFLKMVMAWDKYDKDSMKIHVKYVKSSQLPVEVFEKGETRKRKHLKNLPEKCDKKKQKISNGSSASTAEDNADTTSNMPNVPNVNGANDPAESPETGGSLLSSCEK